MIIFTYFSNFFVSMMIHFIIIIIMIIIMIMIMINHFFIISINFKCISYSFTSFFIFNFFRHECKIITFRICFCLFKFIIFFNFFSSKNFMSKFFKFTHNFSKKRSIFNLIFIISTNLS